MGRLTTRLERLEQRRPRSNICPEHVPRVGDYREHLAAVSPDADERARYNAQEDALEAAPGCPRCGWKDEPAFRIVTREDWGQHEPA